MMWDYSALILSEYLELAHSLEVINLSWNRITSYGGTKIFEGIKVGRWLRSANLAYNSLGKSDSFALVESVQSAIWEEVLRHLDLSYNRMKKAVCEKLGMLIYDNHSLYGIHMEGNEWYVDKYGYIQVDQKGKYLDITKNSWVYPKTLNGFTTTIKFSKDNKYQYRPTVNWWVCEGWTENIFEVKLGKSFSIIEDPVHIHFDYNYFKPELMKWIKGETYTYTTMCPPGKIKYFFTIDKIAVFAKDHPKLIRKFPKQIQNIEMYDEMKTYNISRFNYRIWEQGQVLNDWYMPLLKECMPRLRQFKYRNKTQYRVKEQWVVEKISICWLHSRYSTTTNWSTIWSRLEYDSKTEIC